LPIGGDAAYVTEGVQKIFAVVVYADTLEGESVPLQSVFHPCCNELGRT
jgi:hypothetical protein